MKLVRVPLRISFVGGGTDLPSHYEKYGGAVVSATINKYIYITTKPASPLFPHKYRLVYSQVEECNTIAEIKHPIIRSICEEYKIESLDLDVMSDIPAGTGMGSSSAFTVGMHLLNSPGLVHKKTLAERACTTEITRLKEPIGKQDQYAAAFGGFNLYSFAVGSTSTVPLGINTERMGPNLHLFYIGGQRKASEILKHQNRDPDYKILNEMADLANECASCLFWNYPQTFGQLVKSGWELKKRLSPLISNNRIDTIIATALNFGATGAKLLGAGGCGFILVVCPPDAKARMLKELEPFNLTHVPFEFDTEGAKVLYED